LSRFGRFACGYCRAGWQCSEGTHFVQLEWLWVTTCLFGNEGWASSACVWQSMLTLLILTLAFSAFPKLIFVCIYTYKYPVQIPC
jgi:hypothetical protein